MSALPPRRRNRSSRRRLPRSRRGLPPRSSNWSAVPHLPADLRNRLPGRRRQMRQDHLPQRLRTERRGDLRKDRGQEANRQARRSEGQARGGGAKCGPCQAAGVTTNRLSTAGVGRSDPAVVSLEQGQASASLQPTDKWKCAIDARLRSGQIGRHYSARARLPAPPSREALPMRSYRNEKGPPTATPAGKFVMKSSPGLSSSTELGNCRGIRKTTVFPCWPAYSRHAIGHSSRLSPQLFLLPLPSGAYCRIQN